MVETRSASASASKEKASGKAAGSGKTPSKQSSTTKKTKKKSNLYDPAIKDFLVCALWTCLSSLFGEIADYLGEALGGALGPWELNVAVLIAGLVVISSIPACQGAFFNPVNNAALVVAGKSPLKLNLLRMAAQFAGALVGSRAATLYIPHAYQSKFPTLAGGLKPGVELHMGAVSESGLSTLMNLVFLWSMDCKNKHLAYWGPLFATVGLLYVGAPFTGPSLNPIMAFSWDWHYRQHGTLEHYVVFWAAPFLGAVIAGVLYKWWRSKPRKARKPSSSSKASKDKDGSQSASKSANGPAASGPKGSSSSGSKGGETAARRSPRRASSSGKLKQQ